MAESGLEPESAEISPPGKKAHTSLGPLDLRPPNRDPAQPQRLGHCDILVLRH